MVFFLRKLAVGLLVSSFFILMQAQAGIVEPIYKQLKDPTTVANHQQFQCHNTRWKKNVLY